MRGKRKTSLAAGAAVLLGTVLLPLVLAASPPGEIRWSSHVGEVAFPHGMHVEDLGIECTECHHPTRAAKLETPHPEIFTGELQRCSLCHREAGPKRARGTSSGNGADTRQYRCATCHGPRTTRAGEFPGFKVAMHATCGKCHEIGTGTKASASCATCHSGPATPWTEPAGSREGRD